VREVECKISKVILNEQQDAQMIWLQESAGERAFAVIVGYFEASSLRDRIRGFAPPRPMTHNLIANCIRELGGALQRVVVTELKENTYYANLIIDRDGETVAVDARPSDGLVLATQENVPVYVAESVLDEASKWSFDPQIDAALEQLAEQFEDEFEGGFEDQEDYEENEDDDEDEDDDGDDDYGGF